jgi:hypothetical protein
MSEILSLEEIREQYPDQWVLIELSKPNKDPDVVRGKVVATAPSRSEIYRKLLRADVHSFAIEYTGEPPEDEAYIL